MNAISQLIFIAIVGERDDAAMTRNCSVQAMVVPTVIGQDRPAEAHGELQLIKIRNALVCSPSILGRQYVMTEQTKHVRDAARDVFVGIKCGH